MATQNSWLHNIKGDLRKSHKDMYDMNEKNSTVLRNIVIFIRYTLMTLVHVVYQVHGHIIQFAYAVI